MTFTKSKISTAVLFVFAITTMWIITPSYACGIKCNPQWWFVLTEMTPIEHMILEAAQGCRDNPQLVSELEFEDICDKNYKNETRIIKGYLPSSL